MKQLESMRVGPPTDMAHEIVSTISADLSGEDIIVAEHAAVVINGLRRLPVLEEYFGEIYAHVDGGAPITADPVIVIKRQYDIRMEAVRQS